MADPNDLLRRADVVAWLRTEANRVWGESREPVSLLEDAASGLERGEGPEALSFRGPASGLLAQHMPDGPATHTLGPSIAAQVRAAGRPLRPDELASPALSLADVLAYLDAEAREHRRFGANDASEAYEDAAEMLRRALEGER